MQRSLGTKIWSSLELAADELLRRSVRGIVCSFRHLLEQMCRYFWWDESSKNRKESRLRASYAFFICWRLSGWCSLCPWRGMQGSTLKGGLQSFSSPRPTTNTAGGRTKYVGLPVWHRGARGSTQHSGGTPGGS
jgi:hypothetical protein